MLRAFLHGSTLVYIRIYTYVYMYVRKTCDAVWRRRGGGSAISPVPSAARLQHKMAHARAMAIKGRPLEGSVDVPPQRQEGDSPNVSSSCSRLVRRLQNDAACSSDASVISAPKCSGAAPAAKTTHCVVAWETATGIMWDSCLLKLSTRKCTYLMWC